jgi:hypothetical protein
MGAGALAWAMAFAASVAVAIAWKQMLARWMLLAGLALFAYLGASVVFDLAFPYRTHNVSIYLVFFLACMLTLSGASGIAVRAFRGKVGERHDVHGPR